MKLPNNMVSIGRMFSVLSFLLGLVVSLVLLLIGIHNIRINPKKDKVSAMIHSKTMLSSSEDTKCDKYSQPERACISFVFNYKGQDYTAKQIVSNPEKYFLGKVINLYINPKNPLEGSLEPTNAWNVLIAVLLVLVSILILAIAIMKLWMNWKEKDIAVHTGKARLSAWV